MLTNPPPLAGPPQFCRPIGAGLLFFMYTATICASVESSQCVSYTGGPSCSKFGAAATFAWFTSFGIVGTMFLHDPQAFISILKGAKSDHYDDIDKAPSIIPPTGTQGGQQKVVDL